MILAITIKQTISLALVFIIWVCWMAYLIYLTTKEE